MSPRRLLGHHMPGALWLRASLGGAAFLVVVLLVAAAGAAGLTAASPACGPAPAATGSVHGVPKRFAPFYLAAAARYELGERGPAILAAIHRVETGFGRLNGTTSSAGAIGHMQFMPATWAAYGVDANGDGRRDPYDPDDAIHAAAKYLSASGAPADWHAAIFAYNHAGWYVEDVLRYAEQFTGLGGGASSATGGARLAAATAPNAADFTVGDPTGCTTSASGPAHLDEAIRLTQPRAYKYLPRRYMAYGQPQQVDARIYANAVWLLDRYRLRVTAARESGHATHGAGLALDLVPAEGGGGVSAWRRSTERLARDLGWTTSCGHSGTKPTCPLVPAIYGVFYNGYPSHGDPAHCSGSCPAHLHVSWMASTIAAAGLAPPAEWVLVFPSPGVSE